MSTDARIHDTGYRPYDGPRRGLDRAVVVVAWHGIQRVLGIKRPLRHKVLPIAIALIVFTPAIVLVGIAALTSGQLEGEDALPSYGDYFGLVSVALVMFESFVAPEALCTDRRTGMLGVYLASPLTRDTYLLGRTSGVFLVIAFLATGPQLLMLIAFSFEGQGPDGIGDMLVQLGRILGAGIAVSLFLTAVSMAISSMTSRRGVASAMVILVSLTSSAIAGAAVIEGGAPDLVSVFDIFGLAFGIGERIYGEVPEFDTEGVARLGTAATLGGGLAWVVVCLAFCRFRYQRIAVRQ